MDEKKIFLIVDDDADDREFFCEAVNEINPAIECITADNGENALEKLRNEIKSLPDFIFLDLNMPRMNGRTCLAELKKDEYLKNIPVIIFTTSSSKTDIDETMQLGATYFITKPSCFQTLRKKIVSVLEMDWAKGLPT